MPLSTLKPLLRNPACFGLLLLLLPLLSSCLSFYGAQPVLPVAANLLLAGISLVLGLAGLLLTAKSGALVYLDIATIAMAVASAIGAGVAGWTAGEPAIAQPLAISGACLVVVRGLCRTAAATAGPASKPSLNFRDPSSWEYLQALAGLALAATAGVVWSLVSGITEGITAGAAVLAIAWPYAPELLRRFATRAAETRAAGYGIELLGFDALSQLRAVNAVAFDRHALLVSEDLVVTDVHAFDRRQEPLLAVAAAAERHATHPVARAIRSIAADWQVPEGAPEEFEEAPGLGVVAMLGGEAIAVGNRALMQELKIDSFTATSLCRSHEAEGKSCLIVAAGGRAVGMLALQAIAHPDGPPTIAAIRHSGRATLLVSGAGEATANAFAKQLGMSSAVANVRPQNRLSCAAEAAATGPALFVSTVPDGGLEISFLNGTLVSGGLLARLHPQLTGSPLRHLPFLLAASEDSRDLRQRLVGAEAALSLVLALAASFLLLPVAAAPLACGLSVILGKGISSRWLRKNRTA